MVRQDEITPSITARLQARLRVNRTTGCHEWTGSLSPNLYGRIKVNGVNEYTHRLAFVATHGDVPAGYDVDHMCCHSDCANPTHLQAVPSVENQRLRIERSRSKRGHA